MNKPGMKRALIVGAAGFAAQYLAQELAGHGYEVFGCDVRRHENAFFQAFEECDLMDADAVWRLLKRVEPTHVINLAAVSSVGLSWKMPQKTVEVNVVGTLNLLEAARRLEHQPDILLIGSSEEYAVSQQPLSEEAPLAANNPYGISKTMQERFAGLYCEQYGLRIFQARSFNHTGVGQPDTFVVPSWCKQAAQIAASGAPGVMRVGNTAVRRDFSHVRDVVRAYRLILEGGEPGAVYNVGSGCAIALDELLSHIVSLSTQPIEVEADEKLFRAADNPVICADPGRICRQLGWKPEKTVFDAVDELYAYYEAKARQE